MTTIWGTFAYFICILVFPESPTWLLSKGRDADAIKAFNFIARFNFTSNRIPDDAKFAESMTRQNTLPKENQNSFLAESFYGLS